MSGLAAVSQSNTLASRALIELTLKVAIFMPAE
jgi:hypothetical protein